MSKSDKRPLFNEYEAYTPEAYALAEEVVRALKPIVDKHSKHHTLRDIESVVLGSAAVITSETILRNALAKYGVERAQERHAGIGHVQEAFELVHSLPRLDGGFLQHLLLVALREPGVATDRLLPKALAVVPSVLKGPPFIPEDEEGEAVLKLAQQLAVLARRDRRFLDNYLAGEYAAPFIDEED